MIKKNLTWFCALDAIFTCYITCVYTNVQLPILLKCRIILSEYLNHQH